MAKKEKYFQSLLPKENVTNMSIFFLNAAENSADWSLIKS